MNGQRARTWDALLKAGLVQGDRPETGDETAPWYVKALLAFSGWLAALFLLGFVGAGFAFVMDNETVSFLVGAIMITGAFAILNRPRNEFLEHLGLAVSLAGQGLVIWAIFRFADGDASRWLLVAVMQALLAAVMPSFVHRVFSSFLSGLGFSMTLVMLGVPWLFGGAAMLATAWIWLNEFRYPRHVKVFQAVGYGLVLALIHDRSTALFGAGFLGWRLPTDTAHWVRPWMGETLVAAVLLYVVWELFQRYGDAASLRVKATGLLAALALSIASLEAPGIATGVTIALLGFAGGNRVLLGLGVAALLFYVSAYYYLLDATLLDKAQTLCAVSIVLLGARWLLRRAGFQAGGEAT